MAGRRATKHAYSLLVSRQAASMLDASSLSCCTGFALAAQSQQQAAGFALSQATQNAWQYGRQSGGRSDSRQFHTWPSAWQLAAPSTVSNSEHPELNSQQRPGVVPPKPIPGQQQLQGRPHQSAQQLQQTLPNQPLMQQATQPSPAAISDARKCDTAISELRQTKHRVAQNKSQAEDDWRRKAAVAAQAVRSGSIKAVKWIVALPGNIATHLQKPWSEQVVVYKGWWKTIKKEAKHYWMGCKLLAADVRVAGRLINKVLHGKQLTRRERKQLTRTAADVFRLVPFIIFVIVPFMELLLPVALKLFPNMLPSTFEDKLKAEEQLKKRVAAKLEVARFLQGTVTEMAKDMRDSKTGEVQVSAAELYQFMKRVRAGEKVNNFEIMKFAKLFNDELTLDNLERVHLVNLCRFVGIPPFGTDAFLVSRLRAHLARIKMDDRAIKEEGLDSLSEDELRSACRARGMRAPYGQGAIGFMRRQMQEWLDLSLNRALPSSLLLLSRAFTMTQPMEVTTPEGKATEYDSLKDALSSLPNKAIAEASMEAKPDEADKAREYERKLEQLRREEELIREEELEAEALLKSDTPVVRDGQTAPEMAAAAAAAAVVREAAASAMMDVMEGESEEEKMSRLASAKEEKMRKVISALAVLASGSGVSSERDAFMGLVKDEIERLNGEMSTRGSVSMVFHQGGVTVDRPKELQEIVPQKRLADKVSGILTRIEHELDVVDEKIGERMHILDLDNDGLISREELETAMGFLREQLGEDELRMLLDKLNEFGELEEGPINVNNLMQIAQPDVTPSYKSSDDAAKRDTLAGHSQAVAP